MTAAATTLGGMVPAQEMPVACRLEIVRSRHPDPTRDPISRHGLLSMTVSTGSGRIAFARISVRTEPSRERIGQANARSASIPVRAYGLAPERRNHPDGDEVATLAADPVGATARTTTRCR